MKIELKTKEEIALMRLGGSVASRILKNLEKSVRAGITTIELDNKARKMIIEAGAKPSFLGYMGYPGAICISVNDEVVHGIPGKRILREGDLVGLDIGIYYRGFHTDTALTCAVGKINIDAQKLLEVTRKALDEGIKACRDSVHLGDVQHIIQKTIEDSGFGVVRDLVGHGVGRKIQEPPPIANYGKSNTGIVLKTGMTLALEPMVTVGDWHVKIMPDHWTVVTLDGSLAAHFEHTIVIASNGAEILTK